jgi:hypothetical protein
MRKVSLLVILLSFRMVELPALEIETGLSASAAIQDEPRLGLGMSFGVGSEAFSAGMDLFFIPGATDAKLGTAAQASDFAWILEGASYRTFVVGAYGVRRFFDASPVGLAIIGEVGALVDTTYDKYTEVDALETRLVFRSLNGELYISGGVGVRLIDIELFALLDTAMRWTLRLNFRDLDIFSALGERNLARRRRRMQRERGRTSR